MYLGYQLVKLRYKRVNALIKYKFSVKKWLGLFLSADLILD